MTTTSLSLTELLAALGTPERVTALKGIRRGIERECLRITPEGTLAQTDHPRSLGSALTHANITTDYSESLLEFITPATDSIESLIEQLGDIHRHAIHHLGDERIWPLSMPCFVGDEESIRLAQYGSSNIGRMKTLYRQGLKNRYGSLMQVIAGVHFNFSMPDSFWCEWQDLVGEGCCSQRFISDKYMGLIRNVYRFGWLVPYLFGASPAICDSFLKGRKSSLPFQKTGKGTLYLPYATALRLSDLGYTNSAQAGLKISHDNLPAYVSSLRRAINTHDPEFAKIGVKVNGEYRQLNDNVLQRWQALGIGVEYKRKLTGIDIGARRARFASPGGGEEVADYDFIHVVPPMRAPDVVKNSDLAVKEGPMAAGGWLEVDKDTLQHKRYPNVFGVGDINGTPRGKTAATIKKSAPIVANHLVQAIRNQPLNEKFDGYTSCPLIVREGSAMLIEFDYEGRLTPSLPGVQPLQESFMAWMMKYRMLKPAYMAVLKGRA